MESLIFFLTGVSVGVFIMGVTALIIAFKFEIKNGKADLDQ